MNRRTYVESVGFVIQLRNGDEWTAVNEEETYESKGLVATTRDLDLLNTISCGITQLFDEIEDLEKWVERHRAKLTEGKEE
jgi:hypothetical protein